MTYNEKESKKEYIYIYTIYVQQCDSVIHTYTYTYIYVPLINFFLAVLGLRCCSRAFSSCGEGELLFVVVCGLLLAVASLVAQHGL